MFLILKLIGYNYFNSKVIIANINIKICLQISKKKAVKSSFTALMLC